jgi:glycosyltransferase involved in cell wall biosynthesis
MPQSYGRLFRWAHRVLLPILGRRVNLVTTVSALSRDHLIRFGVVPAEKIVVTYNGGDHVARWRPDLGKLDLAGHRPFVLCLGRSQRYKNVELMLKIAPPLDALGLDVCMAGDVDAGTLRQYCADMPANVRLLGRISDDEFAKLLAQALCFVFPSRIEGFGLPAVEAMALGCPVIASSTPCLPEVCGAAALYADPDDIAGWVNAIRRVKSNAQLRRRMIDEGYARSHTFSWRRIAETYLSLMAEVDNRIDVSRGKSRALHEGLRATDGDVCTRGELYPAAHHE